MRYKEEIEERENVIEIHNLRKSFGNNHVINGFTLNVKEQENIAVLGQSGSGKSVLIKCVIGLIKADSGSIKVLGKDLLNLEQAELDKMRRDIGFLFQNNALYDSMTVRENLEFPLRRLRLGKSKVETDKMVSEALEDVGLLRAIDLMPSELSGGMKKRISIARMLIIRPKIILYDEPTTGLDPITSKEIILLMNKVHEKYKTASIIISHDLNCIKLTAHQVVILKDGINYKKGSYDELKNSSDPWINAFFNT
ncbi:MAG: ATP-binding cassette domain-containing protein [Bacteroidetes bacterium]|nr:MAG: ATP-binding cassette domain-containing protein [Bacteroidota bacterium]MBL1144956.1 ATP-binding cassette domain-containing protein [Bacteroidota bacterium]MCB0802166.1 ATP-binding cassette domain-containing protein [Flavobacteriales bacterium]NOG57750.1 ATP-binding cassette domain-containing protein [Bacteroidota bacterium]